MRRSGGTVALLALVLLLALCGSAPEGRDVVLVVDTQVQRLTLYEGQELVKSWPCAVGTYATPSPLGVWKINHKAVNWGTGFGTRFLGFYCPWGKFGIHGTNKPGSIGGHTSHGCIRMLNRDVEELYPLVPYGAKVIVEGGAYANMAAGLRSLRPGSRGADVAEVQTRLKNLGFYYGNPDGVYGEGMKQAVLKYKKSVGLGGGDHVDWNTYQALGIVLFE